MLMDTWVFSLELVQLKLLRIFLYKPLYGHMVLFLLGKHLEEKWLMSEIELLFNDIFLYFVIVHSCLLPIFFISFRLLF